MKQACCVPTILFSSIQSLSRLLNRRRVRRPKCRAARPQNTRRRRPATRRLSVYRERSAGSRWSCRGSGHVLTLRCNVQRSCPPRWGVGVSGGVPNRRAGGQGSSSGSFISFNGGFACKATDGGRRGGRLLATVLGAKGRSTLCDISQSSFRRFSSEQVNSYPLSHPTTTTTTTSLTHNLPAPHHNVRRRCSYHHYCC